MGRHNSTINVVASRPIPPLLRLRHRAVPATGGGFRPACTTEITVPNGGFYGAWLNKLGFIRRDSKLAAVMKAKSVLKTRFRILSGEAIALGPGKVELLRLIAATGSLRQAAAGMEMSYMRAWSLVRLMNALFRAPLVEALRGGKTGGGAKLTAAGEEVLALYGQMEEEAARAAGPTWRRLRRHLR